MTVRAASEASRQATVRRVDVYHCDMSARLGRRWHPVLLRIETESGASGWGEVGLAYGYGATAAVAMVAELAQAFLIGRNAFAHERIWDEIYRLGYWAKGGGPVVFGAVSGIDIALWDLKGRLLGVPIHVLLGGPCHDDLKAYANGWFGGAARPEELAEAAGRPVAEGFQGIKFDPFKTGPTGGKDRPRRSLDPERLELATARMAAVRQAVGEDIDILIDLHGALGPASAIPAARAFAPYRPAFFEEAVDTSNPEATRKLASNTAIPLAGGERLYTRYGFRPFIEGQLFDLIQPDVGLAGGITETKKIGDYADTHNIAIQPHNCAGPVLTAASVQLSLAMPNASWSETFPYREAEAMALVRDPIEARIRHGRIPIPEGPGLGITVNEDEVRTYECTRIG